MAKLNIELVADAQKMLGGLNQSTESASTLFKKLVEGEDVAADFSQALDRDLAVAADKAGTKLKSLENQLKELLKYQEKSRLAFGDSSEEYLAFANAVGIAKDEIAKINKANREASEAEKAYAEELARVEEMTRQLIAQMNADALEEFAGAIDDINRSMREMEKLEKKNTDLGFMILTGDNLGVAKMQLKDYEATLREVIAETGINSKETQIAYEAYQAQLVVVERLTPSTEKLAKANNTLSSSYNKMNTASGGALSKLISIAGNIFKFQLLMGPITAAVRGFKQTITDSVKASAEAEQTFNKLATVFNTIATSATRAAEAIASTLGVSKSTSASALSTVGDLLQAQGMGTSESLSTATSWVSQFYDIINFKDLNMDLVEFAQNFMSGAAGNLRNFRTFGSIVKESAVNARLAAKGLDQLTGSQLELAKMTTRAEMALEQQANAMGATQREWDSMLSVNRRMAEAQKQIEENLGSWLNKALKPVKTIWTEILETINDAVASSKELPQFKDNVGGASPAVLHSREANADLWERESRLNVGGWANLFGMLSEATDPTEITQLEKNLRVQSKAIVKMFVDFGLTVDEGIEALKEDYQIMGTLTDDWYGDLDIFGNFIAALGRYGEWGKRLLGRSDWETETENTGSAFDALIESLSNLTGVGNISVATEFNANSHSSFAQQLAAEVRTAGIQAFNNIKATDLSEFVSAVDLALGEVDESGMVAAKAETIKSLYTILFNQFVQDKTLEENADLLSRIANYYKEMTSEVVQSTGVVASMQQTGAGYEVQLAQVGMTDEQKALDNLRREYEKLKAEALPEEIEDLGKEYENAEHILLALHNAQKKYNDGLEDEANEKERIEQYEAAIKSMNESLADYANQVGQIGMTSEQKALDDLRIAYEKQIAALDITQEEEEKLTELYERQRRALTDLQTKQKEYNDRINAQASAYNTVGGAQQSLLDRAITKDYMSRGIRVQGETFSNPNANQAMVFLEYNKSIQKLNEDLALLDTYVNDAGETVFDFGGGIGYTAKEIEDILEGELLVSLKDLADSAKEAAVTWEDIYKEANPFANEVNVFNNGKEASEGGIGGGIWALLIELLKNTEAFQTLVSMFKDTFVPILDAILKPLMPVLKMFTAFFDNLDWELAFDIMKIIAEILAGTLFVIKAAINTIEAVVKTIFYAITLQWGKLSDVWENYVDTTKEDYATMKRTLEEIRDSNFEIVRNTDADDKDLSLLRDLWNRGIIDEQTYYKESGSLHGNYLPTPVTPYYPTPSRSVTVGNLTINAPNGDINTIIKELYRYGLIDQPVNVPMTAGGYGY